MAMCNICCGKYNKSVCSKVICPFSDCGFEACKTCIRTYLLGTTNDPHCMQCKKMWSVKFVVESLNRSFVDNDYRKHRKTLLVDREISRTPELMNLVERSKNLDDRNVELTELLKEYKEVKKVFDRLSGAVSNKRMEIYRIKRGLDNGGDGGGDGDRKKFIMPCPGDGCKGYLSTQYKCEVCKLFTCPDCFEIIGYTKDKENQHTCLEDNMKSAELIKKETKGCPQCGVRIFKINGCNQMWCTECRVAFNWTTGKIDTTGNVHNPHFYQYMKDSGEWGGGAGGAGGGVVPRNPGDVLCGGLIHYGLLGSMLVYLRSHCNGVGCKPALNGSIYNTVENLAEIFAHLHRTINHICNVDLVSTRQKVRDLINHDTHTVQYILNKKTKDALATAIFKNDNLRKKYVELLNIYELLSVVGIEGFAKLYDDYRVVYDAKYAKYAGGAGGGVGKRSAGGSNSSSGAGSSSDVYVESNSNQGFITKIINFIKEYNALIKYANKQFAVISYTYNQNVMNIDLGAGGIGVGTIYKIRNKKFTQSDVLKMGD